MTKIQFKDLSGWLKFGAVCSISLGIIYVALILLTLAGLLI